MNIMLYDGIASLNDSHLLFIFNFVWDLLYVPINLQVGILMPYIIYQLLLTIHIHSY